MKVIIIFLIIVLTAFASAFVSKLVELKTFDPVYLNIGIITTFVALTILTYIYTYNPNLKKWASTSILIAISLWVIIGIVYIKYVPNKNSKSGETKSIIETMLPDTTIKKKNNNPKPGIPNNSLDYIPSEKQEDKLNKQTIIIQQPIITEKDKNYNIDDKQKNSIYNIDDYVNNTGIQFDIAILVLDKNNHVISSVASGIADLYRKNHSVTTSLFTPKFFNSSYLNEIQNANVQIIDKLGLASRSKYIVIGKYSNDFDDGTYTKYISRASLEIVIISCALKSQISGFNLQASNGFDDKHNAEKGVIQKILEDYQKNHLNL